MEILLITSVYLTVLSKDILNAAPEDILNIEIIKTIINGKIIIKE